MSAFNEVFFTEVLPEALEGVSAETFEDKSPDGRAKLMLAIAYQIAARYHPAMQPAKKKGARKRSADAVWWDDISILVRTAAYKHQQEGRDVTEAIADACGGYIEGVKVGSRTFETIRARNKPFWKILLDNKDYPASLIENTPYFKTRK